MSAKVLENVSGTGVLRMKNGSEHPVAFRATIYQSQNACSSPAGILGSIRLDGGMILRLIEEGGAVLQLTDGRTTWIRLENVAELIGGEREVSFRATSFAPDGDL